MPSELVRSDLSRVFIIEDRAGPQNAPEYQPYAKAGAPSEDTGDITLIRVPSSTRYGAFDVVSKYIGEPGNPTLPIMARYTMALSDFLRIKRKGCDVDVQVHMGVCGNPQDFNGGFEKVLILEAARLTSWGLDGDIGALGPDETTVVNENVPFEGQLLYEVKPLSFATKGNAEVANEVIDVTVCDSASCGACGLSSDGCQVVLAVSHGGAGSPGLLPEVVYTTDGGATFGDVNITSLAVGEVPDAIRCIGVNVVVLSEDSLSLHYANLSDLVTDESHVWAEVTTGFNASGGPRAMFVADPTHTYIVGAGGYIYFSSDPTNGVETLDAGSVSANVLNAIHGIDKDNFVIVGAANTVIYTTNGGQTFSTVTGPAVGVVLNTVWMKSKLEWWIGTAGGRLYFTRNGGTTWTEKAFSASAGTGSVNHIVFVTQSVGYLAYATATPVARLYRTLDGGYSWFTAEGQALMPDADRFNRIALCEDPNIVYAAGLGSNGSDGVLIKGA